MKDFIKTKKVYIAVLAVLFLFVSLSDTTYSLFLKNDSTDSFNYNTGMLDLEFVEDSQIKLENAFPKQDSEAIKSTPYNLTIKNTGSLAYIFDLKMLSEETENTIDYKYIKVKVNDYLPQTLYNSNNILDTNVILYPNEEITYRINIWLDINTPNNELGKVFNAKITAIGKSIYRTIDASGANHPKLKSDMIPVYYDSAIEKWRIADKSNLDTSTTWYNYGEGKWANSITVKNSDKAIFDITGRNNIKVNNLNINNGNVIIENKELDLGIVNYNHSEISNIIRVKFDDLSENVYLISNDKVSYYYNPVNKAFVFRNGSRTVSSETFNIEKNKWYIIGYTYDGNNITFYVDGNKLSTTTISGDVNSSISFKLGIDNTFSKVSKITVGDILFYNRILTDNEISNNYHTSFSIIYQNLLYGYSEFTPMTLEEHYLSSPAGTIVIDNDISGQYVWIPRYKYRVWNILGESGTDSYDAYHKGIEIAFESLDSSSGTIYCEGTKCYNDNLKVQTVTTSDNGKYYTHPAFSEATKELTGFWVGKYEIDNNYQPKNNQNILTNDYLSTYYKNIKKIGDNNDYRVIKNTEWGAIAYLAHSKFGLCRNQICNDYGTNNTHISGTDGKDSTTNNAYGVFDMSGSANEYTMSNVTTTEALNLNNSHFSDIPLGTDDYDLYQANSFILGDATKETTGWYNTKGNIDINNSWISRNNVFGYNSTDDIQDENLTTRIIIK